MVPPLVITFEIAFLITVLTGFNVVELLVAHIDLGVLNEKAPLNISSTVPVNRRRHLGCAKGGNTGDRRLETTPVVGLLCQPLTYDTFSRTFYAVRTMKSRFRNDEA